MATISKTQQSKLAAQKKKKFLMANLDKAIKELFGKDAYIFCGKSYYIVCIHNPSKITLTNMKALSILTKKPQIKIDKCVAISGRLGCSECSTPARVSFISIKCY